MDLIRSALHFIRVLTVVINTLYRGCPHNYFIVGLYTGSHLLVVMQRLLDDSLQRESHDSLHLQQPILDISCGIEHLTEWHHLSLSRAHLGDGKVFFKLKLHTELELGEIHK